MGAGGIGELSRATDSNLARHVAINILPDSVAADAEGLARFDREAKTTEVDEALAGEPLLTPV